MDVVYSSADLSIVVLDGKSASDPIPGIGVKRMQDIDPT